MNQTKRGMNAIDKQKEMNGVEPTNDNGEFIQRLQKGLDLSPQ